MKKGISIWSFTGQPLKECFRLAKAAGFDGVEVALDETGEINLGSSKEDILAIKEQAKAEGVELYSLASGLYWQYSLTAEAPEIREKAKSIVRKQLEIASWLGCDTILVLPGAVEMGVGDNAEIVPYNVAYERSLGALKELSRDAEAAGVAIGIENVWNKFLLSPLELRDFIDAVGSPWVGSYFDVGNVLNNGFPEQWIKILGKRIKKVHFKDYKTGVGSLDGFVDLLAGDVNYPAVIEAFNEVGYDGWCTAEMIPAYKYYPETILLNTANSMKKILG